MTFFPPDYSLCFILAALTCPANSVYEICAKGCDTPCPGLADVMKCEIQTCAEGCICKSGFFNNGTGCVTADQCGCYENGHTYKVGHRENKNTFENCDIKQFY